MVESATKRDLKAIGSPEKMISAVRPAGLLVPRGVVVVVGSAPQRQAYPFPFVPRVP